MLGIKRVVHSGIHIFYDSETIRVQESAHITLENKKGGKMCLRIDDNLTKKVKKRLDKKGKIIGYKELMIHQRNLVSLLHNFKWKKGVNKSNRESKKLTNIEKDYNKIEKGIHIYLKRDCFSFDPNFIIISVTCYKRDFIRAGYFYDSPSAVFMKVTLQRKIMKEQLKREEE